MSQEPESDLRPWPLSRWGGLILLIFGLQVGLIFWLSDRTPVRPHAMAPVPVLRPLGNAPAEFLALSDPTWFALPHREGFSGLAWLNVPEFEFPQLTWTSPPAWLELPLQAPGAALDAFVRSNDVALPVPAAASELVLTVPEPTPVPLSGERSELRLEGGLAQRPLLTAFEPKSQSAGELLTNSVVQAVVDAKGWPQSVALLCKSGSPQADQDALAFAARARFAPLAGSSETHNSAAAPFSEGLLVFAWHTVPTNATLSAAQ